MESGPAPDRRSGGPAKEYFNRRAKLRGARPCPDLQADFRTLAGKAHCALRDSKRGNPRRCDWGFGNPDAISMARRQNAFPSSPHRHQNGNSS
jgi:hypothetical protein